MAGVVRSVEGCHGAVGCCTSGLYGDQAETELKQGDGGPILVHGSATLAQGLAAARLVDRYHLLVFPVILGSGKRLFATEGADKQKLALVEARHVRHGVQMKVYDVVR